MLVADLYHFLDLPEDTPGPARRLAGHLSNIVRAATAGDTGSLDDRATVLAPTRPPHVRLDVAFDALTNAPLNLHGK